MSRNATNQVNLHVAKMDDIVPLISETVASGGSMPFYPRGISMLPMLRQGKDSVILSKKSEKLKKYDLPLYMRADGSYILHRIVKASDDGYTCIGDNQVSYEKGVKHESVIAVVSAFTRNGKLHSTDELTYKMYCRALSLTRPLRRVWRKIKRVAKRIFAKLKRRRDIDR